MGFWLAAGVVFGGLLTTRAHFSDLGLRSVLLGLMATFVIWTWSRALWARTLMVVARRLGRSCGVAAAEASRAQVLLAGGAKSCPRDVR